MASLLFRRIGRLSGILPPSTRRLSGRAMDHLATLDNAYLLVEDDRISAFGPDEDCQIDRADEVIDASGRTLLPAYCDSHTHLVFAAWREAEFVDRIGGLTYEEIAARGGGILNSARRMQDADEEALFDAALARLHEVRAMGTGAIEIKSGYGLTTASELKMLRVIRRLKALDIMPVRATFLGAHAVPAEYRNDRSGYIRLLTDDMLPRIAGDALADYVDVFCDKGFFTPAETDTILEAGARYGLKPKIHANELGHTGGIQAGVARGAVSVDHLEYTGQEELQALAGSNTIATVLPSTAFFLGLPYAPVRSMIDAGLTVALASDYNPGSSPSGNMNFIFSLACIKQRMHPTEAFNALTINGAAAMELEDECGSITPGKRANLMLTEPGAGLELIPYSFGRPRIERVFLQGRTV